MIILINGGGDLDRFGHSPHLGRLVSPRSGNRIKPGELWAGDNDAYKAWDEGRFRTMLRRRSGIPGCLFVAIPDVVADARATLERFRAWRPEVAAAGFPVAFVAQDGVGDVDIPWDAFDAWFIGGSDAWKLSPESADLAAEARERGKHVHMGRVNSMERIRHAFAFKCHSLDGTGWSMFPDHYLKNYLPYLARHIRQPLLF